VNPLYWPLGDDAFVRTYTPDDAETLLALVQANLDRLARWMPWAMKDRSVDDQREWIERCLRSETDVEGNGIWLADGSLAGGIGMRIDAVSNHGEIGYWLDAAAEGRGLVTRACARFLDFGFGELRLHRIAIRAAVANERSRAVAVRLGFTEEGTLREEELAATGEYQDLVAYGLLDREWHGLPSIPMPTRPTG
jgi:ribosomal-protein-serine acetyltransferase